MNSSDSGLTIKATLLPRCGVGGSLTPSRAEAADEKVPILKQTVKLVPVACCVWQVNRVSPHSLVSWDRVV